MSLDPITGIKTLNNLLRVFKIKIPLDFPIISILTQKVLARELNLYFAKLRREDELISFERVEEFTLEELNTICFRRGIDIQQDNDKKMKDLKLWLSISNLRNVPHSLLLYSRVEDFADD